MTKYGLRARVYILTILPTLFIGILLASYFTFNRNQQLDNFVIEQGVNVIEPLAIAAEVGLSRHNREQVKGLISVMHQKMSPLIKSIAVYDKQNQLFVTSNYHRNMRLLQSDPALPLPDATQVEIYPNRIILRAPIWAEAEGSFAAFSNGTPEQLGYVSLQYNKDRALLLQFRDTTVALFMVLFGVLISVLFAFQLTKHVTAPITDMVNIVDKIRQGRLDARVDGKFTGELGLLKHGINSMAKSLAEYHEEMHQSIDQATSDLRETLEQIEIQNIELDIAKREAQQAAKAKSEFLANMSHELRTPLNGVIGFARQLLKTPLQANQADYLNTIEKSANNLLAIINDILDFSKLEAGKLRLERIEFNFRDTLNDVVTLLGPSAQEKNLELNMVVDPLIPNGLRGDPLRIQQVLTNLLGNAIKFTTKGQILVDIALANRHGQQLNLQVTVTDTGIGISKDQQKQLFQAFKQADTSISREYGGTGLGLVITQKLVQQMGGNISLESEPDKGSSFIFNIEIEVSEVIMGDGIDRAPLDGQSLLLFEPHAHSRRACEAMVATWPLTMDVASDDQAFSDKLEQDYSAIVLGHSDWQELEPLFASIEQSKASCEQVIALINSSDPEIHQSILQAGAKRCLSKPLNHHKLAQALSGHGPDSEMPAALPEETQTRDKLPLSVLAVDDNQANLKLITAILKDQVMHIDQCTNGEQAVQAARRQRYDLIFMDIQMPLLDGIAATQEIRKQSQNQDTPIIAVTAHAMGSERENLIKQGFSDYLAKPIDEPALEQCISRWAAEVVSLQSYIDVEHPSFSWSTALQRSNNNAQLALEMLEMLMQGFEEIEQQVQLALDGDLDKTELQKHIHRFHGGTAYTGCSRLQGLCATIEAQLLAGSEPQSVEPELLELLDEIASIRALA